MSKQPIALSPELQRQRQAVYSGLTSVLSVDQANAALESWSIYFSETGSVFNGLNAFARDVCASFDISGQQRDLVKALNRALLSKDSGDRPAAVQAIARPVERKSALTVDTKSAPANSTNNTTTTSELTPDFQTFHYLLADLLQMLENYRSGFKLQALDFLNEVILSMPWSEAQQQQMAVLLATGSTVQTRNYRVDQLQSLLKHFRSWMADEVGAKVAENLTQQALQHTESSLAGIKYAPGNFM